VAYQAYLILRLGYAALPIIAGLDKFAHYLANWDMHLAPAATSVMGRAGITGHAFMLAVGVIEIVAGLLVAIKPRMGAYVVAAWLAAIIINFMVIPGYLDVALRDFGLCLGAIALARLSKRFSH
jgi:uncharacterized membrane protein YphA (DoxX/SURF4 family)